MDKDLGIKVTVTRLRRRLSVESEESNSPPAPSTPTKKRGGRLAAKPQLELIDEDASESVPKHTPRKSIARDAVEEKVTTPARRSTRIRSNTSLLAEAATITPKVTDSPRAKRAARRNSLLESDTDTPVAAPIRQTRRTRKNSTTSVDIIDNDNQTPVAKQTNKNTKNSTPSANEKAEIPANDDNLVVYLVTVTDAATEKESNNNTKSNENCDESSPTIRKSPRLKDKLEKKTPANKSVESKGDSISPLSEEPTQLGGMVDDLISKKGELDKSLTIPLSLGEGNVTSTADSSTVNSNTNKENETSKNINLSVQTVKNEKIQIDSNNTQEDKIANNTQSTNESKPEIKEKLDISSHKEQLEKSDFEKLLENDPRNMQSVIMIDDSDSNSGKLVMDVPNEGEDQCVPVVHSNHLVNDAPKTLDEPEPMDIDESIPLNVTLNDFEHFVQSNTEIKGQTTELPKHDSFELKSTVNASNLSLNKSRTATELPKNDSFELKSTVNASNLSLNKSKRTSSLSFPSEDTIDGKSKRTSSVPISLENCFQNIDVDASNKSKIKSYSEINSSLQTLNKSSGNPLSPESNKENLTINQKLQQSTNSSILRTDHENNSPANINESNGKSSISLSANSKVNSPKTYENKNKSRNSSRHSITAEITDSDNQANKSKNSSLNEEAQDSKSLINIEENCLNDSRNKNKSSTTVTQADAQNLERSTNENKSTLVISQLKDFSIVLSQLKDISTNDTKNASKTPDELNNELSKSITVTDIAKKSKNDLTNVLTSTPLQQKSMQKLGMPINTSMISPNAGNKSVDTKSNKKASNPVESSDSDSTDEEDSVKNKSKMIDDEASEASENYESGDSRDDEERQYEIENEIVERGETLESEQDFSNDSDYEKDSFVVSSDAEDDELLSGTGNDLSLSATELTMSKKSKKKFDERKRKEQKKASREMFEARHNLNNSKKDTKSDKAKSRKKVKQLESSESENETEKPKKKNRMRIDSSHDASVHTIADESIGHKRKKAKRLSESVCADTTIVNEKEITICNESILNINDPLSATVKLEPKTPQKDFNIPSVPIVDKIEEVQVGDVTMLNSNETSDPLQTTIAQEEDSLSSENMEIMQNYDSLLNNLNDQKKVKTLDMSLNIEKKPKNKSNEPIIDQLNLTQTKKEKKNKSMNKSLGVKENNTNLNKNVSKVVEDEESSDCIDMELLFPEESNDSEVNVNKNKQDKNTVQPVEEYIPLKKTEGKINVPETISPSAKLNNSKLERNKSMKEKDSSQLNVGDSSEPIESLKFFVDVTGDLDLSNSKKKNKKKYFNEEPDIQSNSVIGEYDVQNVTVNDEAPLEVSFKSDKKKKKKHKDLNKSANESIVSEKELNNEVEKREADNNSQEQIENKESNQSLNISVKSDKKKKKKNKNLNLSNVEPLTLESETQSPEKKSSDKLIDDVVNTNMTIEESNQSLNISVKSDKKKKKNKNLNLSNVEPLTLESETQSPEKKSSEKLIDDVVNTNMTIEVNDEAPLEVSFKSDKKKKKKHKDLNKSANESIVSEKELNNEVEKREADINSQEQIENKESNQSLNISVKSDKKKKNKKNKNLNLSNVEPLTLESETQSPEKKTSEKLIDDVVNTNTGIEELNEEKPKKRKLEAEEAQVAVQKSKKKRKLSDKVENLGDQGDKNVTQKVSKKRKRQDAEMEFADKKAKVSKEHSLDKIHIPRLPISVLEQLDDEPPPVPKKKAIATSKKRKLSDKVENLGDQGDKNVTQKVSKKRKRQDAEMEFADKKAKVSKEHSLDKIHIPRLPISVLEQLDDEPPPVPKKKAIATSKFIVEDARSRKNKPSTYLEQSIYLNDTPKKNKKKQKVKKNPVLPFMPTAETSDQGFTSNFRINVESETPFVASNAGNFKADFLAQQRIKKMGSFQHFKTQRSHKLCKF